MSTSWDNATLKKLKSLVGKGLSTAEIGKKLGVSKNAVVGKLNRLGWNPKAGGVDVKTEIKPVKTPKSAKKTVVETSVKKDVSKPVVKTTVKKVAEKKSAQEPAPEVKADTKTKVSTKSLAAHQRIIQHPLGLANLKKDQCRWPIGDPDSEDFHFCGKKVFAGKPYCFEHCKQAYQ